MGKSRTAIISDTHFDQSTPSRLRFEFMREWLETLNNKADRLVIAGDLFHLKGQTPVAIVDEVIRTLKTFQGEIIVITGQHDIFPNGAFIAPTIFKRAGIEVIEEPTEIVSFLFVPFQRDEERFLDVVKNSNTSFVICHQPLKEAVPSVRLSLKDLPQGRTYISGDYHKGGTFSGGAGITWTYCGVFGHHSFADEGAEGRVVFVDHQTLEVEIEPVPFPWEFRTFERMPSQATITTLQGKKIFARIRTKTLEEGQRILEFLKKNLSLAHARVELVKDTYEVKNTIPKFDVRNILYEVSKQTKERFPDLNRSLNQKLDKVLSV